MKSTMFLARLFIPLIIKKLQHVRYARCLNSPIFSADHHFAILRSTSTEAMSAPPDIETSLIGGTIFFSTVSFIGAGTHILYKGHLNPVRYTFWTSVNVGVAGGLFTGPSLPFLPSFSRSQDLN